MLCVGLFICCWSAGILLSSEMYLQLLCHVCGRLFLRLSSAQSGQNTVFTDKARLYLGNEPIMWSFSVCIGLLPALWILVVQVKLLHCIFRVLVTQSNKIHLTKICTLKAFCLFQCFDSLYLYSINLRRKVLIALQIGHRCETYLNVQPQFQRKLVGWAKGEQKQIVMIFFIQKATFFVDWFPSLPRGTLCLSE